MICLRRRSRARRGEEFGPPLRVDACLLDEDDTRGREAKPYYALDEEAWARGAPSKLASDAREQERGRTQNRNFCMPLTLLFIDFSPFCLT